MEADFVFVIEEESGISIWSTIDKAKEEVVTALVEDYHIFDGQIEKPVDWGSYFTNEKYDYLMENGGADLIGIERYQVDAPRVNAIPFEED